MNPIDHDDLIKLNERLDAILSSDKALEAAAKSKSSLFRAAAELTQAEHPQVTDAMRERMRAKMLQAVPQTELIIPKKKAIILRPQFSGWAAKVAAIALILFFVGLATPPALASSLPGDALYPVKRGIENVELAFAGDYIGQVNVHLAHSQRRLDESERLISKARFDTSVMQDALSSLETAIGIANDHDLFVQHPELEGRAASTLSAFNQTLATAEAAELVAQSDVLRLESNQDSVMAYMPSVMADPSNSSEVNLVDNPPSPTETSTEIVEATTSSDTVTAEATEVSDAPIAYVNADGNVNVREGAGTAYAVIARITPNTAVTMLGVAGDWTEVRLVDGRVGWIANFLLSETPMPDETSVTSDPDSAGTTDSTGATSSGSIDSPPNCNGQGRSCEAPGHGGENPGTGNSSGNANGGRDD
jgi:hypothetical protein